MVGFGRDGGLSGDLLALGMTFTMAVAMVVARHFPAMPFLHASCMSALLSGLMSLPFGHPWGVSGHDLLLLALFGLATFSYASFSTIANVLPTDLYRSDSVASVSGLSGTGAGIGTIIAFELIGHFSDARQASGTHSFDPIVIVAGLIPFIGMILVLLLVRNTRATDQGLVRRI